MIKKKSVLVKASDVKAKRPWQYIFNFGCIRVIELVVCLSVCRQMKVVNQAVVNATGDRPTVGLSMRLVGGWYRCRRGYIQCNGSSSSSSSSSLSHWSVISCSAGVARNLFATLRRKSTTAAPLARFQITRTWLATARSRCREKHFPTWRTRLAVKIGRELVHQARRDREIIRFADQ